MVALGAPDVIPVMLVCVCVLAPPVAPYVVDASGNLLAYVSEELETVVHPAEGSPLHMAIIAFVGDDVAVIFPKIVSTYGGVLLILTVVVLTECVWAAAATVTLVPGLRMLAVVAAAPVLPLIACVCVFEPAATPAVLVLSDRTNAPSCAA
jgi:hypothetical protein